MNMPLDRCRLVLITPDIKDISALEDTVSSALRGGDVASVIIPQRDLNEHEFQDMTSVLVPIIQKAGAAALVAGDTRVMGRCKADGIHVTGNVDDLYDAVERFSPEKIVGGGNAKDRHSSLSMGDTQPDYLFFGKLDGDIKSEPHPKNIKLGQWWSEFVEIPCIVMGGTDIESALEIANVGCDFLALNLAIFSKPTESAIKVAEINALLDEKAPRFETN
ncbi:thiamine phosphate synthase [Lentilitoribacter sp. Alg239-R112]|jgi:thiamine-phosphate pyrophosphorylase|uniref:thiamine phosphate synthase n=1 Tax=Lentilitoribacter sp. Alg239-R112 TaxID=2305987 RepID=UPI0013A70A29|nr:thiamine phosphate synthase [Lentilitoribacter sp. Alg239-R112]